MFKWLFHILIFATSGKYQTKENPLKHQRRLASILPMLSYPGCPFITRTVNRCSINWKSHKWSSNGVNVGMMINNYAKSPKEPFTFEAQPATN